jgi:hypothetical protein
MIRKYAINFQRLNKGASRPTDDGQTVECETDSSGFMLVPNVGDFVQLTPLKQGDISMTGRVRSRMFLYAGEHCVVNIVVEDTDDDWGLLIKE